FPAQSVARAGRPDADHRRRELACDDSELAVGARRCRDLARRSAPEGTPKVASWSFLGTMMTAEQDPHQSSRTDTLSLIHTAMDSTVAWITVLMKLEPRLEEVVLATSSAA
ncbi:MAG: hypothetical protein ABMA15_30610, partial [Vicinamibacterales bacterium]